MSLFQKQKDFVLNIDALVFDQLRKSLTDSGEVIADYIVQKQLYEKGINSKKEKIRPFYAASTKLRKLKKGQPIDRVTLRDTKALHDSLSVSGTSYELLIEVDTPYAKYVIKRYGSDVIKPTIDNMKIYFDNHFIKDLKTRVKNEFK
jgi:hypothetical protein